jgi:membrane associated rhomboid family serine protease
MHLHLPNPERLSASTRTLREAFWLTIISIVAVYAFFMVIGSISPSTAAVATLIMGGLLVLYVVRAWHAGRTMDTRDPRIIRARERRGF